jgi:hypothetical protein
MKYQISLSSLSLMVLVFKNNCVDVHQRGHQNATFPCHNLLSCLYSQEPKYVFNPIGALTQTYRLWNEYMWLEVRETKIFLVDFCCDKWSCWLQLINSFIREDFCIRAATEIVI